MSRLLITSDLHLGHKNIHKFRKDLGYSNHDEHDRWLYDRIASSINKPDTVYFLGDVAFNKEWLHAIGNIKCRHKKLILGNHDRDHHTIEELVEVFDSVDSLLSKRNCWFTHCPIHPDEIRRRHFNIHGHTHGHCIDDKRYLNVCVEHTDYKPISFEQLMEKANG